MSLHKCNMICFALITNKVEYKVPGTKATISTSQTLEHFQEEQGIYSKQNKNILMVLPLETPLSWTHIRLIKPTLSLLYMKLTKAPWSWLHINLAKGFWAYYILH